MRIALVAGNADEGPISVRGHIPLRYLKDKYDFDLVHLQDMTFAKMHFYDAIIVFHSCGEEVMHLISRAKYQLGIPVIVDFDDLLDGLPSDHPQAFNFKSPMVKEIAFHATWITVSTMALFEHIIQWNNSACVIENTIDPLRYSSILNVPVRPKKRDGFVVGWTGSVTHLPDLLNTGFVQGLSRFMDKFPDTRAYFHGLCPSDLDKFGVRITFDKELTQYADYPSKCASFDWDLCAVPLAINPFNDAKSDLRILDMAPFGINIISSKVREFRRHNDLIYQADNSELGWFMALQEAYKDAAKLAKAQTLKDYVVKYRLARKSAFQWDRLLQAVIRSSQSNQRSYLPGCDSDNQDQRHGKVLPLTPSPSV